MTENVQEHSFSLSRDMIESKNGHKGCVLWLYGLSGSGKSTLADAFMASLAKKGVLCKSLDGDNLRLGMCSDLGFSEKEREENIRRAAHSAKLFSDFGTICVASFITPKKKMRQIAKDILGKDFLSIYIKAPLSVCQERDPKGFYKKALDGKIKNYTGLGQSFEATESEADLILDTSKEPIDKLVQSMFSLIQSKKILSI